MSDQPIQTETVRRYSVLLEVELPEELHRLTQAHAARTFAFITECAPPKLQEALRAAGDGPWQAAPIGAQLAATRELLMEHIANLANSGKACDVFAEPLTLLNRSDGLRIVLRATDHGTAERLIDDPTHCTATATIEA